MDLENLYSLRKEFTVIGITGRTGSGCTSIAEQLTKGFQNDEEIYPLPDIENIEHNSYRKYRIIYNYAKENFKPYTVIYYKDVIFLYLLAFSFEDLIHFLNSDQLKKEFNKSGLKINTDFSKTIKELSKIKKKFQGLHKIINPLLNKKILVKSDDTELLKIFKSKEFQILNLKFNEALKIDSIIKRNKTLQVFSNNIRKSGSPYVEKIINGTYIFKICHVINHLIKGYNHENKKIGEPTKIVIDSFRNPIELMYFKQRFSAFYTLAINRDDEQREIAIKKKFAEDIDDVETLLKEEHKGGERKEFYMQCVSQCIQVADIHITYRSTEEVTEANKIIKETNENTSPFFTWGMQLLKYVSLIDHPGLITPSPEERCMQLAFTAKYNSGCISRQVGAAITDQSFSVKAIGWNNTPEGQVPCNLRNAEDLLKNIGDLKAFTPFEKNNTEFKKTLSGNFENKIKTNQCDLKGRNVCFCFKSLHNSYTEGKNQVHTRSLHAEESAFLQITKYGGQGINGGKLFTTASPCELCSKKAYQLGIKVIYYIDPYPGISRLQILEAGKNQSNPKMRLFNGAIGNAYHWLYEPMMAYKDELSLILEQDIKDLTSTYKSKIIELEAENKLLKEKI